jgi:hypothetical protein
VDGAAALGGAAASSSLQRARFRARPRLAAGAEVVHTTGNTSAPVPRRRPCGAVLFGAPSSVLEAERGPAAVACLVPGGPVRLCVSFGGLGTEPGHRANRQAALPRGCRLREGLGTDPS